MLEIGAVGKDGKNQHQQYEYTSAAAVMAAAQKALARHGLRISSTSAITDTARYSTKNGEGTRVTMRTTVTISDGEQSISADGWGCGQDTQDKAPMKAQTASYKYALSAALCIGFGDDPEADEEANDGGPKAEAPRKKASPEKATAGELLALCKTPTELNLWCGIHGASVQALQGESKRVAWAQIKTRATAIGVSEEQVLAWLTGAPEAEEAENV